MKKEGYGYQTHWFDDEEHEQEERPTQYTWPDDIRHLLFIFREMSPEQGKKETDEGSRGEKGNLLCGSSHPPGNDGKEDEN